MTARIRGTLAFLLVAVGFAAAYHHVIARLVAAWWVDENYSHGFLIVPIALYLVWERRHRLAGTLRRPSNAGLALLAVNLLVLAAGVLGAELFVQRLSLVGAIASALLFLLGGAVVRLLAFPILFLLLMVPIPAIIFNQVAFPLQLMASWFGELALRAFSIPVLREGNVITLANATLEVAEACSGIRSLVSLLTLAIVYGYFIERRVWFRVALAAAAVPVAIVANGLRVAGTGIAAHHFGEQAAVGFFHSFSGWLVFLAAFALLFIVERVIRAVSAPAPQATRAELAGASGEAAAPGAVAAPPVVRADPVGPSFVRAAVVATAFLVAAAAIASATRSEQVPLRESFATFPMQVGAWQGSPAARFDQRVLSVLGVDEYVTRNYATAGLPPVHLYVGYYRSQREGDTIHSPLNCLPGAGWEPTRRDRIPLRVRSSPEAGTVERTIEVNRIVIQRGLDRQFVLYWYQTGHRVVASEYWGKVYTVLDAIRYNRTDAAMVRLISPIDRLDQASEAAAERSARAFAEAIFPLLGRYLPD